MKTNYKNTRYSDSWDREDQAGVAAGGKSEAGFLFERGCCVTDFKKTRHKKREGRCFELSGEYVLNNPDKILVHGTINSQVLPIAHAWVENENGDVYDLVENKIYSNQEYYENHQAVKVVGYTHKEAAIKAAEHGHWGPWQEKGYKDIPNLVHH